MDLAEQDRARNASRFKEFLCVGYPGPGRRCGGCGGRLFDSSHFVARNFLHTDKSPFRKRDEGILRLRRITSMSLRQIGATVGIGPERTSQILKAMERRASVELI